VQLTRLTRTLTALAALACASSCSSAPSPTDSRAAQFEATFLSSMGYPFSDAAAHGISLGVLEILDEARAQGLLTRSEVEQSLNYTFACFDDAGIQHERTQGTDVLGLPSFDFTYRAPIGVDPLDNTASWIPVADACQANNSFVVQTLYENQPTSGDTRQAWFATNEQAQVAACLTDRGVLVPDGAQLSWFVSAAKDYMDQTGDSTCLEMIFG
jgi:hypothetical protein